MGELKRWGQTALCLVNHSTMLEHVSPLTNNFVAAQSRENK